MIGKKVVPNENWGSNTYKIKEGVIIEDYPGEWRIKADVIVEPKEFLVYKDEVDIIEEIP